MNQEHFSLVRTQFARIRKLTGDAVGVLGITSSSDCCCVDVTT